MTARPHLRKQKLDQPHPRPGLVVDLLKTEDINYRHEVAFFERLYIFYHPTNCARSYSLWIYKVEYELSALRHPSSSSVWEEAFEML